MRKNPYSIIPKHIVVPKLNYSVFDSYSNLKDAQLAIRGRNDCNIYKYKFDESGMPISCKLCKRGN